jgi:uncharacterized membrane protein
MLDFLQGKWLKHPLHPALVHMPTALWPAAWIFDLISQFQADNVYVQLAFYAGLLSLLVALIAIPTGFADWMDIRREKPAWRLGLYHMSLNLIVTVLWAINIGLRMASFQTATVIPLAWFGLSTLATLLLFISGYLGGRMIYAYGISVARISKKKWRKIAQEGGAAVPPENGE